MCNSFGDIAGYLLIAFLGGWFLSRISTTLRLNKNISFWMRQRQLYSEMYDQERVFFKEAISLYEEQKEKTSMLRKAFIERLTSGERKELDAYIEIAELEKLYTDSK